MKYWHCFTGAVGRWFKFMDRYSISRRVALFVTIWSTYDSYTWVKKYAETSTHTGMEIAAIIGAVLAAVTAMQVWVLKLYIGGAKGES